MSLAADIEHADFGLLEKDDRLVSGPELLSGWKQQDSQQGPIVGRGLVGTTKLLWCQKSENGQGKRAKNAL